MINFEDNLSAKSIILRYTSKPERGLYLFYNPLINFFICNILEEKEKQKNKMWARVQMTQTSILIGWGFFYWNCDWTSGAFHYTGPTGPRPLGLTNGKMESIRTKTVRPNWLLGNVWLLKFVFELHVACKE